MWKFTQKERDIETTLDFSEARYFSSPMGRFTSPDPIHFQAQMVVDPRRFNLYSYVRNNPLILIDPDGESIQLNVTEQERKRLLEALKQAVGKKAGQYLYEDVQTDNNGNKTYFVGVYTNGPTGKGSDFKDLNKVTNEKTPMKRSTRIFLSISAVLLVASIATCYFGERYAVGQIPPETLSRMSDTDILSE